MKLGRRLVSILWLFVAIAIAVFGATDIDSKFWRPTWLLIEMLAFAGAIACSASMIYSQMSFRIAGVASSSMFLAYCAYLFAISPPSEINTYAIGGATMIALCLWTIGVLVGRK